MSRENSRIISRNEIVWRYIYSNNAIFIYISNSNELWQTRIANICYREKAKVILDILASRCFLPCHDSDRYI